MKTDERIHKSSSQCYILGYVFCDTADLLLWKENSEDQEYSRAVGLDMYTPRDGPPRLHKPFTSLFPSCTPPSRPTTHLIAHAVSERYARAIFLPQFAFCLVLEEFSLSTPKAYFSGVLDCPLPLHFLVLITPLLHDVVRRQSRSCHSPRPCHTSASAVQLSASLASGREPQRSRQEPQDVPSSARCPWLCRSLEKLGWIWCDCC